MDPFSWRLHVFSINLLTPKCFVRGWFLRCVWNKTSVKRSTFYCKEILFPLSPYRKYYRRIIKLTMWKLLKCPPSSTTLYSNTCLLSRGKTNISWKASSKDGKVASEKHLFTSGDGDGGGRLCPEKSNHWCRKKCRKMTLVICYSRKCYFARLTLVDKWGYALLAHGPGWRKVDDAGLCTHIEWFSIHQTSLEQSCSQVIGGTMAWNRTEED